MYYIHILFISILESYYMHILNWFLFYFVDSFLRAIAPKVAVRLLFFSRLLASIIGANR